MILSNNYYYTYSYAAAHPEDVNKMVIIDTLLPGFGIEEAANFSPNGLWHLSFHAVRDLPEKLINGQEDIYLNWFYDGYILFCLMMLSYY